MNTPTPKKGKSQRAVTTKTRVELVAYLFYNVKKSMFYSLSDAYFDGRRMETIFSTRSAEWHRFLRGRVSQLYSMSNLRGYEPYADECTAIFTRAMYELQGQRIDFSEWLQWYVCVILPFLSLPFPLDGVPSKV